MSTVSQMNVEKKVATVFELQLCHLRSREVGSPQCRPWLYVLGVLTDLLGDADFATMVKFLRSFLPSVHKPSTIDDCACL